MRPAFLLLPLLLACKKDRYEEVARINTIEAELSEVRAKMAGFLKELGVNV